LAAAGKRVVLVSADLRRPTLEEMFGVTGGVGFVDVLRDSVSLSDALRDSGVENLRLCGGGSRSSVPVVMAGPGAYGRSPVAALARSSGLTPSGPAELIGSDRAARVIEEIARDLADFVLVDAPPLLAVADAAALAPACDAVLVVAAGGTTTRADVLRAREQLECVRATLLGAVLLDHEHRSSSPASYQSEIPFGTHVDQRPMAAATATAKHQAGGTRR